MKLRTKLVAWGVVMALLLMIGVSTIPQQPVTSELEKGTSHFVISSWAYPDEYGQGIRNVAIEQYTNETWVPVNIPSPPRGYYYDPNVYEITNGEGSNGSLWIVVQCYLNSTVCGINDINDGPALIRHTLTVTNTSDSIVFYQENFTLTYQTDYDDPLYFYQYEVFTDFVPVAGEVYTATIIYEVWY